MSGQQRQNRTNIEALLDLTERQSPESRHSEAKTLRVGEVTSINFTEANRFKQIFFQERSLITQERSLKVRESYELETKIQKLHQELIKLSTAQSQVDHQLKFAVLQAETSTVGTYHVTFLEHLISIVLLLRKNAESASTWLTVFLTRNKKKGYYWGQVKKQGSKFYLSPDRYSATQVG